VVVIRLKFEPNKRSPQIWGFLYSCLLPSKMRLAIQPNLGLSADFTSNNDNSPFLGRTAQLWAVLNSEVSLRTILNWIVLISFIERKSASNVANPLPPTLGAAIQSKIGLVKNFCLTFYPHYDRLYVQ